MWKCIDWEHKKTKGTLAPTTTTTNLILTFQFWDILVTLEVYALLLQISGEGNTSAPSPHATDTKIPFWAHKLWGGVVNMTSQNSRHWLGLICIFFMTQVSIFFRLLLKFPCVSSETTSFGERIYLHREKTYLHRESYYILILACSSLKFLSLGHQRDKGTQASSVSELITLKYLRTHMCPLI